MKQNEKYSNKSGLYRPIKRKSSKLNVKKSTRVKKSMNVPRKGNSKKEIKIPTTNIRKSINIYSKNAKPSSNKSLILTELKELIKKIHLKHTKKLINYDKHKDLINDLAMKVNKCILVSVDNNFKFTLTNEEISNISKKYNSRIEGLQAEIDKKIYEFGILESENEELKKKFKIQKNYIKQLNLQNEKLKKSEEQALQTETSNKYLEKIDSLEKELIKTKDINKRLEEIKNKDSNTKGTKQLSTKEIIKILRKYFDRDSKPDLNEPNEVSQMMNTDQLPSGDDLPEILSKKKIEKGSSRTIKKTESFKASNRMSYQGSKSFNTESQKVYVHLLEESVKFFMEMMDELKKGQEFKEVKRSFVSADDLEVIESGYGSEID